MGWAGQTWIEFILEGTSGSSYGVFNSGGTKLYPTIYGANAFTPRVMPDRKVIRTADAGNRRREVVARFSGVQGTFNTLLRPDEATYWLNAATAIAPDGGGKLWLPSYSVQFWDSTQAWRLTGGMIQRMTITSSAQADYVTLSMNWIFQRRDAAFTSFTQPAENNYSTLVPYGHTETASNCTIGGSAFSKYKSVSVTINNDLKPTRDELPYISALYYCGRDIDFSFGPQYLATAYRGYLENQTPLTFALAWNRTLPAHSLSLNLETNSYVSSIQDDLPLDGPGYQDVDVQCFFDPANSNDFTYTAS